MIKLALKILLTGLIALLMPLLVHAEEIDTKEVKSEQVGEIISTKSQTINNVNCRDLTDEDIKIIDDHLISSITLKYQNLPFTICKYSETNDYIIYMTFIGFKDENTSRNCNQKRLYITTYIDSDRNYIRSSTAINNSDENTTYCLTETKFVRVLGNTKSYSENIYYSKINDKINKYYLIKYGLVLGIGLLIAIFISRRY